MQNDSQLSKRVETVMKVQLGQMTPTDAAKELGITRQHYYRIEEEMLGWILNAVTPKKRGPKVQSKDPKIKELEDKLKAAERQRDILQLKVNDLQSVTQIMKQKYLEIDQKKKERRHSKPKRDEIPNTVQAADLMGKPERSAGKEGSC